MGSRELARSSSSRARGEMIMEPQESTKVASVVTDPQAIKAVADRMRLRAYRVRATTGMNLTRVFRPTIKGFNADYGTACKTWADVATESARILSETAP